MEKTLKIVCAVCQKEHYILPTNQGQLCCSRSCANRYRASKVPRPNCSYCGKMVYRQPSHYQRSKKDHYCNKICEANHRSQQVVKKCQVCAKEFKVRPSQLSKKFCSQKCMGIGNRHYSRGNNPQYRSFGECSLLVLLRNNFPQFDFVSNDRQQLDGFEIDIWIPKLNIGIEYNGQHHFKPVYGTKVFAQTQQNDIIKRAIAHRKNIKIIDINQVYNVSKTTKTKIINMFIELCKQLSLQPKTLDLNMDDVFKEKYSKVNEGQ